MNLQGAVSSEAALFSFLTASFYVAAAVAELVVAEPVLLKAGEDVVDGCLGDVVQRLLRQEGLMGGDNDVGHGDEAREKLVIEDVA